MNAVRLRKRPLDSRQLLAFVTVARTLSFTQAGKELFVTQSAVSHAVKALEDELGHRLLHRDGKKLQITPAGEHLLHYAGKIMGMMSEACAALDQRRRWGANRLRLAANGNFSLCLMPAILKSFRREFPNWPVSVKTGDTHQCVEWLEQNEIDLAIAIAPSRAEAVEMIPLFTDEVMWIVSPSHRWAQSGYADPDEIASQTYVCSSTASYTSRLLEKFLERDGIRMNCGLELANLGAVKEMVKDGAGVAALATWSVRDEIDNKSLVALPLGKRKLKRNWCLLRSPDWKPGLAGETFVKFAKEAGSALVSLAGVAACVTNVLRLGGFVELETVAAVSACFEWNVFAVAV